MSMPSIMIVEIITSNITSIFPMTVMILPEMMLIILLDCLIDTYGLTLHMLIIIRFVLIAFCEHK